MSERLRTDSARYQQRYPTNPTKMSEGDLGTRKTLFVLVIVVGCFAVLWPKVFYPMLVGPANQRIKPSSVDKGCCDVISDIDVNTIKIMSELCNNIVQQTDEKPLKGQEIITRCRNEILNKCGIDISAILQEQVRLGRTFKQIVDEVRSINGSLCLKYNFGVSPWRFGATHKISINLSPVYVRQERPAHLRPEMLHPALREKGRAIAQPYQTGAKGVPPKFVEGRPGPVPGIRPPMGGAGHVVHPQKNTTSMGIIMPIYTVGIVIFFSYTLMKLLFKKRPEGPGAPLYPPVDPSMTFRREVFEAAQSRPAKGPGSSKLGWKERDARDEELDLLRRRLRETELAMERIVAQMAQVPLRSQKEPTSNGTVLPNGNAKQSQEHEQPSVKVLGMEMTASCEGGERWSRPESPVMPSSPPPPEPTEPPQEIYLEGALPAQSQILVADSTTEAEPDETSSSPDPAVVLASKMTLSVISLDSPENENGIESTEKSIRNGDAGETEHEILDEDIIDESKYTTASGATAAERDILEGEQTDEEADIEDEMEKLPDCVVDNGVQQIEDIEDLQDDVDIELHLDDDIEIEGDDNVGKEETPSVRFSEAVELDEAKAARPISSEDIETISDVIDEVINTGRHLSESKSCGVKFIENIIESKEEPEPLLSPEAIESISDVIDDVINVGTQMSELISAEREADSNDFEIKTDIAQLEPDDVKSVPLTKENLEVRDFVKPNKALEIESDEEEEEEVEVEEVSEEEEIDNLATAKTAITKPLPKKVEPVEIESEEEVEEEEIEVEVSDEEIEDVDENLAERRKVTPPTKVKTELEEE